ncbi:hypothetical protein [Aliikangiella sp. IMCC44359]|uniref:hypothetical protein n=1 Tax=Aliikangiella sp. IMCC44359 TaxID=3459125 RepID=UPI00403B310D
MKTLINMVVLMMVTLFVLNSSASSSTLTPENINGVYYLGTPERGQSKVIVQFGQLGGKNVVAVAACKKCPPAVYTYNTEESQTLGVPVFSTAGLYLFKYDDDSFVLVQPDGILGRKIWKKIGHANIYSKNQSKSQSITRQQIETFAIKLSSDIMNQDIGEMAHNDGRYYLAIPVKHLGKAQKEYTIEFLTEGKKQINIKPCDRCPINTYQHLPEESAIAGVDVYLHATSYYLFDLKDGVLISTFANAGGLGKVLWDKHNHYNVFSNNQAYIRQILSQKEKQNIIDQTMAGYFKQIKLEFEKRANEAQKQKVANQKLPQQGLKDPAQQKQALQAAKQWANAWNWKETLKQSYFIGNDWAITRNPLTGIITGKIISGIVTMTHPDGRCRFQYVSFRQDHDGNQFTNFHMTGVGPIYDLNCDNL